MQLREFTFHAPQTIQEAIEIYSQSEGVRIKAGGTFLINTLKRIKKRGGKSPGNILSLSHIPELQKITTAGGELQIGAMVTMAEIMASEGINDNTAVLNAVAALIGNTPIRNMATIGGNLTCRYTWTEMPAAMLALDANLHFVGVDQKVQVVSAKDFFKNAAKTNGILTKVSIQMDPEYRFAYQRATKTIAQDIPLLAVCVGGKVKGDKISDVRIAINNCTAFAQRDKDLEAYVNQCRSLKTVLAKALPGLDKEIYTTRGDEYKQHMFGVCLSRALKALI